MKKLMAMGLMRNLIGMVLMILGGVLTAITDLTPFFALFLIGTFLFASFTSEDVFVDYKIANTDVILFRKRYYMDFLPFTLVSSILTLGKAPLKIVWKEEYFKGTAAQIKEDYNKTRISRGEYIALRNEQRGIYSIQPLSSDFMNKNYTIKSIGFKRKKIRLIITAILIFLTLTMAFEPEGIYISLIYEVIFVPMFILWIPDYKDAKILQQAYERALNADTQTK